MPRQVYCRLCCPTCWLVVHCDVHEDMGPGRVRVRQGRQHAISPAGRVLLHSLQVWVHACRQKHLHVLLQLLAAVGGALAPTPDANRFPAELHAWEEQEAGRQHTQCGSLLQLVPGQAAHNSVAVRMGLQADTGRQEGAARCRHASGGPHLCHGCSCYCCAAVVLPQSPAAASRQALSFANKPR